MHAANDRSEPAARLGCGLVRHVRQRPVRHEFRYPTWFLMLPMRRLREAPEPLLSRNGRGWMSFHDRDHGEGGPDALAWCERLLAEAGVDDADGEIWLHTYPRVFGFAFKPVSFWFAQRADGSLAAVLAEVNNTFGERHVYLLDGPTLGWGREVQARKVFHVSPFCRVEGRYRFRFLRVDGADGAPARSVARVDLDDAEGALLSTSVSGQLEPLDRPALRRMALRMPLLTFGIVARIHWQALRLWLQRVPFWRKPLPPALPVSR
ncbi:MAG: DUF1365 domain-containing protein [Burkholderiaceae bacterium]|nr:DUF1365 domain-containing protein [Burkholderiaceae bacterium]